ncbi:MAG: zinc metallopeptidase [Ruminococcaceae bacterium]|nr:zinc metallopeptidase [Oscillospiraceae bacterium]
MFYFDYTYLVFVVPAMLLALWAQFKVQSTFKKYSSVISMRRMTGHDAARRILDANGLYNVKINRVAGNLTDHFDPRTNTVNLSDSVYDNCSVAAIGVAAHESGHAVQHAVGYGPIKLRTAIIPITQIGSNLAMPLVLIGLLLSFVELAYLGCIFFATATLFQLVTLPVEFNASSRAMAALENTGILGSEELKGSRKVLTAAAMTYVAALAVSLGQLLRLLIIVGGRDRD